MMAVADEYEISHSTVIGVKAEHHEHTYFIITDQSSKFLLFLEEVTLELEARMETGSASSGSTLSESQEGISGGGASLLWESLGPMSSLLLKSSGGFVRFCIIGFML